MNSSVSSDLSLNGLYLNVIIKCRDAKSGRRGENPPSDFSIEFLGEALLQCEKISTTPLNKKIHATTSRR